MTAQRTVTREQLAAALHKTHLGCKWNERIPNTHDGDHERDADAIFAALPAESASAALRDDAEQTWREHIRKNLTDPNYYPAADIVKRIALHLLDELAALAASPAAESASTDLYGEGYKAGLETVREWMPTPAPPALDVERFTTAVNQMGLVNGPEMEGVLPADVEAWLAEYALAASPAAPPAHEDGDFHNYRVECSVCGQRGTLQLAVEPQRYEEPALASPADAAGDGGA
jgi:hypothetical protein